MSGKDVNEWDVAAVESWISSLGPEFKKHAKLFVTNDINGRRLLKLTDEKLEKMGISSLGVRDDIVEAIQKLAKGDTGATPPAAADAAAAAAKGDEKPASPPPAEGTIPFDQKKALETFVENAKYLLKVMKEGSPTEVVGASTNLVKSVRVVLDHPDVQGKLSDESRAGVIATLGVLISNAKLVAVGDQNAKGDMQSAVPTLIRSINQIFLPPSQPAAQPTIVAQSAPKPSVPIKPVASSPAAGLRVVPSTGTKPGPLSPFSGPSANVAPPQSSSPAPPVSPSNAAPGGGGLKAVPASPFAGGTKSPASVSPTPSPVGSFRQPSEGGVLESVTALYSAITHVTQMIKNMAEQQALIDGIVKVITGVTKLLKESDTSGRALVDHYGKREVFVHHSTVIAQEVKSLNEGKAGGEFLTLKSSLKAISNAAMELLVDCIRDQKVSLKCPVCSKNATEDSILCEGPDSCGRWFHRECVGLYPGSFFHTGWTCGVVPCKAKLKEAERLEAEKRRAKEEALLQRQRETQEIHEQKRKWEEDLLAQKKKEEEKQRALAEQAERERQERLQRIRNLDVESRKLEEEYQKMNEESLATTGLTIEQLNVISRWQPKAKEDDEEGAVIPREKKEAKAPQATQPAAQPSAQPSAPGSSETVNNPPIPLVKSVRLSTLLDDHEDVQVICRVRAIYDYDPIGGDGQDLRFKTGDYIDVIKKQKDGWWEGILDGYVGFFYSSFVQEVTEDGTVKQGQQPVVITHAPGMKKKAGGNGFEAPVPKITLGDLSEPDFDGWLWKEGNRKNWKKQWFVLKDFCLYFFENNKYDANALGLILIPGYTIAPHQDPKREHTFTCEHPSARTYFLAGETKQDANLWIETLNRASQAKSWNEEETDPLKGSKKKPAHEVAKDSSKDNLKDSSKEQLVKEGSKDALQDELKNVLKGAQKDSQEDVAQRSEGATESGPKPPSKPERAAPKPKLKPEMVVSADASAAAPAINSPKPPASDPPAAAPLSPPGTPLSPQLDRRGFKGSVRGVSNRGGGNIKVPVPNIVVKDLKNASFSGWLYKQGFSNKGWKKRWFVLEGFCLYYFESAKNDSKALGMVMLPSYSIIEVPTAVSNRVNCFDVVHPSARCYSLSAESEGSKEDWMEKLNAAANMS